MAQTPDTSAPRRFKVGQRIIKTAVAIFLCYVIYYLRGCQGEPFYSVIAAIICMQSDIGTSRQKGINRIWGTLIGALFGSVIILLDYFDLLPDGLAYYFILAIAIIPVIKLPVMIGKAETTELSCVVFLSIAANHITDAQPFVYVFNRILDTVIGIVLALIINQFHLPRKRQKDILFVSALDDALAVKGESVSGYGKVVLNEMLDNGANITIATERTPAALQDVLKGIRLTLPVITMNGAALYDLKNNHFVMETTIPHETAAELVTLLDSMSIGVFVNSIVNDVLLIYISDIKSMEMQQLYRKLRVSPYRNYMYAPLPEGQNAAYLFSMEKADLIEEAAARVRELPFAPLLRVVTGPEPSFPDCRYLKIYHRDATVKNMTARLAEMFRFPKVITLGTIKDAYDIYIPDSTNDRAVHTIRRIFEPYIWEKTK